MTIHIENVGVHQTDIISCITKLLIDSFIYIPDQEKDENALLKKVRESCADHRISRVALDKHNQVIGWISGISHYAERVWELHPLAVNPAYQQRGIGSQLVNDFEDQVRARDGITIYLGTDDQWGGTNLFQQDIYPNVWEQIQHIRNLNHHPYAFYEKLGYVIVGIVPDANGLGKPDILMAKRVVPWHK